MSLSTATRALVAQCAPPTSAAAASRGRTIAALYSAAAPLRTSATQAITGGRGFAGTPPFLPRYLHISEHDGEHGNISPPRHLCL
jgi:hypothetical protein